MLIIAFACMLAILLITAWQISNSPYRQYERSLRKPIQCDARSPEQKRQERLRVQNTELADWDQRFARATNDDALYSRLILAATREPTGPPPKPTGVGISRGIR